LIVCSRCGTANPQDNKFCRECGTRLEHPAPNPPPDELEAGSPEKVDIRIGELLYQAFQLYETNRLEEAMARCKDALRLNAESTSGHSLLGMIYEKQSDLAAAEGNEEAAKDYALSAMRQYERVLEINPGSVADAEKVRELRAKLRRWDGTPEPMTVARVVELSMEAIRQIPGPVALAAVAGFVAFVALLMIWSRSSQPGPRSVTPVVQPPPPAPVSEPPAPVYRYSPRPATVPEPQFASPTPAVRAPSEPQPSIGAPASPEASEPERTVIPPVRITPKKLPTLPTAPETPPRPAETRPAEPRTSTPANAVIVEKPRGHDLQLQGMELARQNKPREAIASFRKAIEAYEAQIKAGEDVESANAGIRTCRHYIELLESP